MDNAQLYLSLVRPSMIPVVGESADDLFKGQVEVTNWKWSFHNEKEKREAEQKRKEVMGGAGFLEKSNKSRELRQKIIEMKSDQATTEKIDDIKKTFAKKMRDKSETSDPDKLNKLKRDLDEALDTAKADIAAKRTEEIAQLWDANYDAEKEAKRNRSQQQQEHDAALKELTDAADEEDRDKNFQFSFAKRIDIATTQMLNSMKAGDKFPVAIFTMHQYSSNNPMSLVIKISGLRLLKYAFAVDASDTMTDLKEEWTCDFETFSYVYQNRRSVAKPSLGSVSDAKQIAAKAATQGTVRSFIMLPKKL